MMLVVLADTFSYLLTQVQFWHFVKADFQNKLMNTPVLPCELNVYIRSSYTMIILQFFLKEAGGACSKHVPRTLPS